MNNLVKINLLGILVLLSLKIVIGQEPQRLLPNKPTMVSLKYNEKKILSLVLKADDYAELDWLSSDSVLPTFKFLDLSGNVLEEGHIFVAPKDGTYLVSIELQESENDKNGTVEPQKVTLEYKNKFMLPRGSKQQDAKKINGYDIKIFETPYDDEGEDAMSIVIFQKAGIIKRVFKDAASRGYIFNDPYWDATLAEKKKLIPAQNYIDKTGDGIPDIVIAYNTHIDGDCCWTTYVVNLGETADLIAEMNQGMRDVVGTNSKGGIRWRVRETTFDGWNGGYSPEESDDPERLKPVDIILEFKDGKPRPNFELMRKPPPTLTSLSRKAQIARQELSLEAYRGEDNENSVLFKGDVFPKNVFWVTMLDLIYTGNEDLAWQFLDLVWDTRKQGKQLFIRDFKKQLAGSQYWQMIEEDKKLNK